MTDKQMALSSSRAIFILTNKLSSLPGSVASWSAEVLNRERECRAKDFQVPSAERERAEGFVSGRSRTGFEGEGHHRVCAIPLDGDEADIDKLFC